MSNDLILVAQVSHAVGLTGEFKLLSYMDDPLSVLEYNPLLDDKGNAALSLVKAREHKGALVVKAEGVYDRTAAEKLKGLKLYVDRADLPDTDEDEYYVTDLIGMDVVDTAGNAVGKVVNVDNFGAGDLLDVKPLEGVSFYVPFTLDHVPEVHLAEGRVVVDLTGL